jgi:hypothetical protein
MLHHEITSSDMPHLPPPNAVGQGPRGDGAGGEDDGATAHGVHHMGQRDAVLGHLRTGEI